MISYLACLYPFHTISVRKFGLISSYTAAVDSHFYEVLQLSIWFHYQIFSLDFRFESLSVALLVLGDIASSGMYQEAQLDSLSEGSTIRFLLRLLWALLNTFHSNDCTRRRQ